MSKTAYSDEEVKKVLRSLFLEKKKVEDLQQKLRAIGNERNELKEALNSSASSGQEEKLKKLVLALKKKLETAEKNQGAAPSNWEKQLQAAEQKNTSLEKQLKEALQSAVSSASGDISRERQESLEQELKNTQEALFTAKREASRFKERLTHAEEENCAISQESRQLKAIQEKLQEELRVTQGELESAQNDLSNVINEQTSNAGEFEKILSEKQAAVQQREQIRAQFETLEAKVNELTTHLNAAQDQQAHHKQQNEKLVEVIESRERRIEQLEEYEYSYKKIVSQKRDVEQALHLEQKRAASLQMVLREREQELSVASDSIAELENGQESFNHLKASYEATKNEVSSLQEALTEANKEAERLQSQLVSEKETSASANNRLQENHGLVTEISQELNLTKQTLVRGIRELKEIEARYRDAVDEKVQAIATVRSSKEQINQQNEAIASLKEQLAETTNSEKMLNAQVALLQQNLEETKNEQQSLSESFDQTNERNTELLETLETANEKIAEFETQVAELSTRVETNDALSETVKNHEETIRALNETLNQSQETLTQYEKEIADNAELQEKYYLLKEDFEEMSHRLNQEINARDELGNKTQQLQDSFDEQKAQIEELEQKLQAADDQATAQNSALEEAKEAIGAKEEQLHELKQQFKRKVADITNLNDDLEQVRQNMHRKEEELGHQSAKIGTLEQQLASAEQQQSKLQELLNESIRSSEMQVSKWEEKYLAALEEMQSYKGKIEDYKRLESKHRQMQSLFSKLGDFIGGPLALTSTLSENDFKEEAPEPQTTKTLSFDDSPTATPSEKEVASRKLGELFEAASVTPKVKDTLF